jgi:wyosine [tRNA(Phe)-imidazoG37] synthetase (radical SAM superfamily)
VYCEIGKTEKQNLVSADYKIDLPPQPTFRKELNSVLKHFPHLDSISFSGYYGEPTLNIHLAEFLAIARKVRDKRTWDGNRPDLTLFTNSSTFHKKRIRNIAGQFDVVLAKLDAGTQNDYLRTVRPHRDIISIEKIITSISKLKSEMPHKNKLILQCLLYNSYKDNFQSNANERNINALAEAINKIKPDGVQIYSIARAPAEYFVYALGKSKLEHIAHKLKNLTNLEKLDIINY